EAGQKALQSTAALHLLGVAASHGVGLAGIVADAGIALVGAAPVAVPAGIIGEIEIVGVVAGDAQRAGALGVIPADEVDGVCEARPSRGKIAGFGAVLRPGAVQRLRIAGCG